MLSTKPRQRKTVAFTLPMAVALCAPAVRTVVISACANRGPSGEWETHIETAPVLAIRADVGLTFEAMTNADGIGPRPGATAQAMERAGWSLTDSHASTELLIWDESFQALGDVAQVHGSSNVAYEVVPCPWPPSQDEKRLAQVRQRVAASAIRAAERYQARPVQAKPPERPLTPLVAVGS